MSTKRKKKKKHHLKADTFVSFEGITEDDTWVSSLSVVPRTVPKRKNKEPGYIGAFAERKKDVVKHQKVAAITKITQK